MRAVLIGLCFMAGSACASQSDQVTRNDPRLSIPKPDVRAYQDRLRPLFREYLEGTLESCMNQALMSVHLMEGRQQAGDLPGDPLVISTFAEELVKRSRSDLMTEEQVDLMRQYYSAMFAMAFAYPALTLPESLSGPDARIAELRMDKLKSAYATAVLEPCIDGQYVKRRR